MKLSIVILNWNGSDMMRRYLPSVVESADMDGVEVVVADNGSDDDSLEMLEKDFPSVRIVELDRNYGFAEGYNKALREVEAEYYLLLNSDVEIHQKDWLKPLLHYMDTHHDVAACQPKMLSLMNPDEFEYAGAAGGMLDRYGYPFCRGRMMNTVERDEGQYDEVASLLWATGAALMIRSHDYWNAGGLDARFFAHQEEIDLCWRLRTRGRKIVCVPQSTAYHLGGATLHQGNPHKTFLNFRNNLLMLYKNLSARRLHRVMLVRLLLDYVAAVKFLLGGSFGEFSAVLKARFAYHRMKPDFRADRRHNLEMRTEDEVAEQSRWFILWEYYMRGRRCYSELK